MSGVRVEGLVFRVSGLGLGLVIANFNSTIHMRTAKLQTLSPTQIHLCKPNIRPKPETLNSPRQHTNLHITKDNDALGQNRNTLNSA